MAQVAINGFGRIGRLILRSFFENQNYNFEIAAINDLQSLDSALYLFKYDSVHGTANLDVQKISENEFTINGKSIKYTSVANPENLPWKICNIDLVIEATGIFKSRPLSMKHVLAGAKKVLISCPAEDADRTIIYGVNNHELQPEDIVVSNGSCTTNCLAPIVKVVHENFDVLDGHLITIHSYTGDQRIVDTSHKDLRRARAAGMNMIPTSTGASATIGKIFPELQGKIQGLAVRVPTPNVSMIDFSFHTRHPLSLDKMRSAIKHYSASCLQGILGYTENTLVSSDFNHSPYSAIVDLPLVKMITEHCGNIVAWYDNEWAFSQRMLDVASFICKKSAF